MAKTKEEINQLIAKIESAHDTLHKLADDELQEISGGGGYCPKDQKYPNLTCFAETLVEDGLEVCFYIKFGNCYQYDVKYLVSYFYLYRGEHCPGHDLYMYETEIDRALASGELRIMDYQI